MSAREDAGARREERRAAARYDVASFVEPLVCRVNPGHEVDLVNVSAAGACVEASFALLPGRPLQLHAQGRGRRLAIEARVMWCKVTAVMPGRGVRYAAGLAFMRWVDVTRELAAFHPSALKPRAGDPDFHPSALKPRAGDPDFHPSALKPRAGGPDWKGERSPPPGS